MINNKLNTSYPARIVSFDPVKQTAVIELAIEAFLNTVEAMYIEMKYAKIHNVPVHFPQCAGYAITFPIKPDDDCLAVFTQRGYEHWLYEAKMAGGLNAVGKPSPSHMRGYSKNDAMVFVGFNPIPKAISNFSPDNLEIRSKDMSQFISIRPNGSMEVTTPANLTINAGSVVVNTDTATINADKTTVNGLFEVNGDSTFNGNVAIAGALSVPNASAGGATIAKADIASATINGVVQETHVHTTQGLGSDTSTPH